MYVIFRMEMEAKYREALRAEMAKVSDRHRREISSAKKKQWCYQCDNEVCFSNIPCIYFIKNILSSF